MIFFQENFTPIVNTNLKSISFARDQIEEVYANFIRILTQEKSDLLNRLNECENEK
jgi:hypothetical protein